MVALVLYSIIGFGLALYVIQIIAVRITLAERENVKGFQPPISILKPLKGLDDSLFDNLESFCNQDYPRYEVLLALRDADDPAYKVACKIREKYPQKDIRIVAEWCEDGLNPKVNNMVPAYRVSKYKFILISDSNVMVGKDYLAETARHMADPRVGLVSSLIRGVGARSIGSVFENLHLNTFTIGGVCFLEKVMKMPCVVGKSMLIRKEYFEELGGFAAVKDYLAEDYILGKKMAEIGKRVVLSNYIINTVNEYWRVKGFISRHTRWGKLRWQIGGLRYLLEIVGNPVFMSLLPIAVVGPSKINIFIPIIVFCAKALGDLLTGRAIKSDLHPALYLLSPVKDVLIGFIWFVPIFSNKVEWRGDRFTIKKDSLLAPFGRDNLRSVGEF